MKLFIAAVSLFAFACIGCAERQGQDLSSNDLDQIVRDVNEQLAAFHTADTTMNAEGVIALLWPEFSMLADGNRMYYDDVVKGSRSFMASLVLFQTDWTDIQITPLGRDAAVSSFQFRDSIITKAGDLIQAKGPTTFVWQKRGAEWRVLFADADHYPLIPPNVSD